MNPACESVASGGLNKTHPDPLLRIANAEKSVKKYAVRDTRSFRTARFNFRRSIPRSLGHETGNAEQLISALNPKRLNQTFE
jgi:hypothetical protein